MPFTPLHIPVAYATWKLLRGKVPLAPLVLANMAPDLEVPIIYVLSNTGFIRVEGMIVDRLVLHSILGGLILIPLIMLALYPLYSKILSVFSLRCPKGRDRDIVVAGSIGGISHVLLDAVHHPYNPLLYPFTVHSINILVLGNYNTTGVVIHILFSIILFIMLVYSYTRYRSLRKAIAFILGCKSTDHSH